VAIEGKARGKEKRCQLSRKKQDSSRGKLWQGGGQGTRQSNGVKKRGGGKKGKKKKKGGRKEGKKKKRKRGGGKEKEGRGGKG